MSSIVSKKREGRLLTFFKRDIFDSGQFFRSSLLDFNGGFFKEKDFSIVPDASIIENENDYLIELAAPGLERKNIMVMVKDDILIVSTENTENSKAGGNNDQSGDSSSHSFYRSFNLFKNLDLDHIDTRYHNGILKIRLQKKDV